MATASWQLLAQDVLLNQRARITNAEADKAGLTVEQLINAGFRRDSSDGYRLES